MKNFLRYQFPLLVACTAVFIASSLPSVPSIPLLADKIPHAIAYGFLGILAYRAFRFQDTIRSLTTSPIFSSVLFAIIYGISDEIHQLYVPGRHGDVWDVVADAIGALVFVYFFARYQSKGPRGSGASDSSGHAGS